MLPAMNTFFFYIHVQLTPLDFKAKASKLTDTTLVAKRTIWLDSAQWIDIVLMHVCLSFQLSSSATVAAGQ